MKPELQPYAETQPVVSYLTIEEQGSARSIARSCLYSSQKERPLVPLKHFQEHLGRTKPSFFQDLKSIFGNKDCEERYRSPSFEQSHIQGSLVSSRLNTIKRKREVEKNNNFKIQTFKVKELYRKAKLNNLLQLQQSFTTNEVLGESSLPEHKSGRGKEEEPQEQTKPTVARSAARSFRVNHSFEKDSLLNCLNPLSKKVFTVADLSRTVGILHNLRVKLPPSHSYFNVYVEEGNNSDLLKMLIRRRSGWRVVEIPAIANFIWTQFYRKTLLKKRLSKREKTESEEEKPSSRQLSFGLGRPPPRNSEAESRSPSKQQQSNFPAEVSKLIPNSSPSEVSRLKSTPFRLIPQLQVSHNILVHNHFPFNKCISDKKNLLLHLTRYLSDKDIDPFHYLPQSYEVSSLKHPAVQGIEDSPFENMIWIIKPGEDSNRGRGIVVTHSKEGTLEELRGRLERGGKDELPPKKRKSLVLQKYLMPLLYYGRKFDIRGYMLVTFLNNQLRVYHYQECYIRTSSKPFSIDSPSRLVHLTNDSVQSASADYGKFQEGNKVSDINFGKFIDEEYRRKGRGNAIWARLKEQMKRICVDVIEASYPALLSGLGPKQGEVGGVAREERAFYFQLFGMDYMVDENFKLWMIEVNTNPALTHDCSKLMNLLMPKLLDNVLNLAVEPIMKPLRQAETPSNNRFTAILKRTLG